MRKIIRNAIRCNICGDEIVSTSVHDFKWCTCKACAIDGGHDYLRRLGDCKNWTELSVTEEEEEIKK